MYIVKFSNGSSASTFDKLDGDAAIALTGRNCYVIIEASKDGKYQNIARGGIRTAP